jgi:hypothetical protein
MWNADNTGRLIRKVIEIYGEEMLLDGSKSVEGLEDHLDKMVAKAMRIDKKIITIARQWRKAIERAAITEGIDKVESIIAEEETQLQVQETIIEQEIKEVEMTTETKETREEDTISKEVVEVEMEIRNDELTTKKSEKQFKIEDIEVTSNLLEFKSEEVILEERFGELNEWIKEKCSNPSLDGSIWAPKRDSCEGKENITARVLSANIAGKDAFQRERSLKWILKENTHIKEITEKFLKGNHWCVIIFDCNKGYKEAVYTLENKKEEHERIKLILEEVQDKTLRREKAKENADSNRKLEERREKIRKKAKEELKEVFEQRKAKDVQYLTKKGKNIMSSKDIQQNKEDTITVWDIPKQLTRSQIFEAVRHLGRIEHIEVIREDHRKLRAEITLMREKDQEELPWVIPLQNELLVRLTPGKNRREILEKRKQYITKLYNVPKNINEILLFRQLKHSGARAVHVFRNANGNNKQFAVVSFKNKRDLVQARRYSITYYNTKLVWETEGFGNENNQMHKRKSAEEFTKNTWRKSPVERNESSEDETSEDEGWKSSQSTSVYPKRKRKEIKEGKKKDLANKIWESLSEKGEQKTSTNSDLDYIFQLMKGMNEKINNIERGVPQRS